MFRKLPFIQKVLLLLVAIFAFFMVLSVTIGSNKKIPGASFVSDTVSFVQQVVLAPINYVEEKVDEFFELQTFYDEYKVLKSNLDEFALVQARNHQLEQENKELRALLEVNESLLDFEIITATVLTRDIDSWQNELTINVGELSGVEVGMAVIVSDGLIGKIIKVDLTQSVVQLITTSSKDNKISVVIASGDKRVNGVIQEYIEDDKSFEFIGIETEIEPKVGDLVITSGIGGVYPSGLPVGRVIKRGLDDFSYYQVVHIESEVDFNNIHFVEVLRKTEDDH
jgi:rod shape-determining protein MreC